MMNIWRGAGYTALHGETKRPEMQRRRLRRRLCWTPQIYGKCGAVVPSYIDLDGKLLEILVGAAGLEPATLSFEG